MRDGQDVLVVWRLGHLGRSLKDLIELVNRLEERKIGFKSLQDPVDTTSPGGKLVFHIIGALAESGQKPDWLQPERGARRVGGAGR